jgi:two-component system NarL family response regulator
MTGPTPPIRVLVVERLPLLRRGIAASLTTAPEVVLVGTAHTVAAGMLLARRDRPTVALVGTTLRDAPGAVAAVAAFRDAAPETACVVVTADPGADGWVVAARAGAAACCGPAVNDTELVGLVRRVAAGESPLTGYRAVHLAHAEPLTGREWDVLYLVARGRTNRQVARALALSPETVKHHLEAVMRKLGVRDRTHAVTTALRRGVLTLADLADDDGRTPTGPVRRDG